MAKKRRTPQEASIDSAAQEMLIRADGPMTWSPAILARRGCAARFAAWAPAD
ncbi:MAG: hypothetical protein P8Y68_17685 [Anaerolineales bacterium]